MREMKDSGIEWIGKIPGNWSIRRLRFLCTIETGNMDTQDHNPEGKYPFYVRSPIVEYSDSFTFDNEAVLMAGDGVGAGKIFHYVNGKYGCHQRVYSLHSFAQISGKFLYYYLLENFHRKIEENNAKSTVDSIRLPMIKDFPVVLPPFEVQQKISDYLDHKCSQIDTIIARQQEVIEKLKAYKLSVITEAVTKGLNPDVPMKDSGIEWIGEIPEHWEIVRLKLLGTARNGLTYSPSDICDANEGTLVLRSSNIQNGQLTFDDNVYVSCEIKDDLMVRPGDILICSRNGSRKLIGKNAIIDDTIASFGAFMMIFRTNQNPKYIKYILDSSIFMYYLGTLLTSTINQLTGANFNSMEIPFTWQADEQETIVNYLDAKCTKIEHLISIKQSKIDKLTAYKKSLIYEVVTGKKEV